MAVAAETVALKMSVFVLLAAIDISNHLIYSALWLFDEYHHREVCGQIIVVTQLSAWRVTIDHYDEQVEVLTVVSLDGTADSSGACGRPSRRQT